MFKTIIRTFLCLFFSASLAQAGETTVFAAASLKNSLDEIAQSFEQETGNKVILSFAASSALAKQIEAGAPAEMFISADLAWMDYLEGKDLIKANSRKNLLGNRLVLVAANDSQLAPEIKKGFDLKALLAGGRLAIANTAAVPAGKYGKASLTYLDVWDSVKSDLAEAENVRAALALVARGEAPLGIVYATDAASEKGVKIIATFPEESHQPIIYPSALTTNKNPVAEQFLGYISTPQAMEVFIKHGFSKK